MGYTVVALKDRIMEMYPEIEGQGVSVGLRFEDAEDAYLVTFRKDGRELATRLGKKDADECMDGIKCVYLGVQIEQFIKNFKEVSASGGTSCR